MNTDEIEIRFTFHPVKGDQGDRYQKIRDECKALATVIDGLAPDSREKSLAFTALEEVSMWANAAIARREV